MQIINNTGAELPGRSVVEIEKWVEGNCYVILPTIDSQDLGQLIVTYNRVIPISGIDVGIPAALETLILPVEGLFEIGNTFGTVEDSLELIKENTGFICIGKYEDKAILHPQNSPLVGGIDQNAGSGCSFYKDIFAGMAATDVEQMRREVVNSINSHFFMQSVTGRCSGYVGAWLDNTIAAAEGSTQLVILPMLIPSYLPCPRQGETDTSCIEPYFPDGTLPNGCYPFAMVGPTSGSSAAFMVPKEGMPRVASMVVSSTWNIETGVTTLTTDIGTPFLLEDVGHAIRIPYPPYADASEKIESFISATQVIIANHFDPEVVGQTSYLGDSDHWETYMSKILPGESVVIPRTDDSNDVPHYEAGDGGIIFKTAVDSDWYLTHGSYSNFDPLHDPHWTCAHLAKKTSGIMGTSGIGGTGFESDEWTEVDLDAGLYSQPRLFQSGGVHTWLELPVILSSEANWGVNKYHGEALRGDLVSVIAVAVGTVAMEYGTAGILMANV